MLDRSVRRWFSRSRFSRRRFSRRWALPRGFPPRGFLPRGFLPRGFLPRGFLEHGVAAARRRLRHPWTPGIRRRPLGTLDFVVVDVETTGWSPAADGITEIGAVRISGGQVRAEFAALVNPGRLIPADIVALTGITEAMVAEAPPVSAVLPGFLDFARGAVLTAHNAPFDVGFLSAACEAIGRRWPAPPVLDTVTLARLLLTEDEVPNCKLATLADFFGAPARPNHRALADARATAAVLAALLDRLPTAGVRTLAQLSAAERAAGRRAAPRLASAGVDGPRVRR
jgi:DNA polymerase-3 subunit epsilon